MYECVCVFVCKPVLLCVNNFNNGSVYKKKKETMAENLIGNRKPDAIKLSWIKQYKYYINIPVEIDPIFLSKKKRIINSFECLTIIIMVYNPVHDNHISIISSTIHQ